MILHEFGENNKKFQQLLLGPSSADLPIEQNNNHINKGEDIVARYATLQIII